jgi:hypothetical protein
MSADEKIVQSRNEISAVERYITSNKLSSKLELEIRSAMRRDLTMTTGEISQEEEREVFLQLSHSLQVEVTRYTCSALINKVSAFDSCNQHFKDSVSTSLQEETFSPGTFLVKKNEPCTALIVIASGVAEIMGGDDKLLGDGAEVFRRELAAGGVVGQMAFFFGMRHLSSVRSPARSFVSAFIMQKPTYDRLMKLYPAEEDQIMHNVLQSIDLMRGKGECSRSASGKSSTDGSSVNNSEDQPASVLSGSETSFEIEAKTEVDEMSRAVTKKKIERFSESNYALCLAAKEGNIEALKKALLKDPDLMKRNYFGRTPLHVAASEGLMECV